MSEDLYMIFETGMESPQEIRIVAQTADFVIIEKPHGIKSAPLNEEELCVVDETVVSWLIHHIPQAKHVKGKKAVEFGLLHRLDTATHGLLILALNQKTYERLIHAQHNNLISKYYTAICIPFLQTKTSEDTTQDGFPICPYNIYSGVKIKSRFRAFGKSRVVVRPVLIDENIHTSGFKRTAAQKKASATVYHTDILSITQKKEHTHIDCHITQGFRHQIRCHLAWAGYPIIGDILYNPYKAHSPQSEILQLHAVKLEIPDYF